MRRFFLAALVFPALCAAQQTIHVGSKRFTESYILGEIITQTIRAAGEAQAVHHSGMGNTAIVFAALQTGAIDLYPEYTGTVAFELLGRHGDSDIDQLNRELAPQRLALGVPLGFSNSYALAMREDQAAAAGIARISDLARHPELRLGLTQEFLNRKDGWPALKRAYGLPFEAPRGLDHGLAYEALTTGQVDVIDIYSTDAKLEKYDLRVLKDDRAFFPAYRAVLFYRLDLPARFPRSWAALERLQGRISERDMIRLNAEVELEGISFADAARRFLSEAGVGTASAPPKSRGFLDMLFGGDFWRLTGQHLVLVFASLALSVAIGIPLGVCAERFASAGRWILAAVGMLQTIPSLALLAFLIALMGVIGTAPAIVALFLYGLLPIVHNTSSGLAALDAPVRESALALGLSPWARLRHVELPLAAPAILAGVKTSAVINVGTATVAAFIGAGGYGERIVAGLAVHDNALLLAGAIPSAALAFLIQWSFGALDRWSVPRRLHRRIRQERNGNRNIGR